MKTFSTFKELAKQEKVVVKSEIQNILSQLSVQAETDLTDKHVEIVGLDEAEIALQEHFENVKKQTRRETIQMLETALQRGDSWNLIVEKILNNDEN